MSVHEELFITDQKHANFIRSTFDFSIVAIVLAKNEESQRNWAREKIEWYNVCCLRVSMMILR